MNASNLYFLSRIEDREEFALYEKRLSMRPQLLSVREHERASLASFVSYASASGASLQDFDSFYYNYSIPQIGKEFDLLKITPNYILNIVLLFDYSVGIFVPLCSLTQTVTQTRKKAVGYRRTQWIAHRAESTQKRRKALRHNTFRRSSYLHTQEVTGSSPAVSTKSHLI